MVELTLDYVTQKIVCNNTTYNLNYPLRCLYAKEDDYYIIQSEILDIMGTGLTVEETISSFAQEFDFIYKRYNELPNEKLSKRLQAIKSILNYLVINAQ